MAALPAILATCLLPVLVAAMPPQDSRKGKPGPTGKTKASQDKTSRPTSQAAVASKNGAASWVTDFGQAKATAKRDTKDLLLDFTGSDWCLWCIRLQQEAFGKEGFQKQASKHFVLVKLDFPRARKQPEPVRKQNQELQQSFRVQSFPTVFLADMDGRPYARTGYKRGGPEIYLGHIMELRKVRQRRDDELDKAAHAEGVERARHLAAALDSLPAGIPMASYEPIVDQIIALDKEDTASLKTRYGVVKKRIATRRAMQALSSELDALAHKRDWSGVAKRIEEFRREKAPQGNELQQLLWIEAVARYENKEFDLALSGFEEARKIDPQSVIGVQVKRAIDTVTLAKKRQEKKDNPQGEARKGKTDGDGAGKKK